MSASSKKKLRNAQQAEQLTEKQLAEQKEAKKLKIFSIAMVTVVALMVVFAVGTAVYNKVIVPQQQEQAAEAVRSTVAATVGDHEVNAVEFNCFFVDAVSNFYNQYGSYAGLMGLDVTKALDDQVYDEEAGTTWADYFITNAGENAKAVYAIHDEGKANGFELSEEQQEYVDSQMSSLAMNAVMAGYPDAETYLQAMYGIGANEETVADYFQLCYYAQCYQQSVSAALEYSDDEIQAKDDENPAAFSNFSYNSYYLSVSKFLEGGTEDEEGNKTYSDEEQAAALAAAEDAAKALTGESITSVEALDAAIAGLSINAETEAASTACVEYTYKNVNSVISDWVTDADRKAGDLTYIPSVVTDEDDKETVSGYYVVYFNDRNDNEMMLQNVRHLLVAFEGGTTENGTTTYSDEEKAAAKAAAEELYEQWKSGEATEDSFAALANEKSDDGDGTTGRLYTDIYPGQMVPAFNDWCFDESRKAGDTEIVETEFGYHIMYYVGASEQSFREYQIVNTLISEATQEWYDGLVSEMTLTDGSHEHVPTGMILSSGN